VGGAWGVGWQVMLDGLEITQFTYFQQCGGMDLEPITGEITYGLERIASFLQDVDSIYDIVWAVDPKTGHATTYGDVRLEEELQLSVYNFEAADIGKLWEHLRLYESECQALLDAFHQTFKVEKAAERKEKIHDRLVHDGAATPVDEDMRVALRRFPVLAAYELCLKCSHLFNLLDARGAISVTERVAVMARIRNMVVGVAKAYAQQRQRARAR
jgi:glycyl-tRNA synthetase alpha chain